MSTSSKIGGTVGLAALAMVVMAAATAGAGGLHLGLEDAVPGSGDTLGVAPTELRLTFTEGVDPDLATLTLRGPNGDVALSEPERGETDREVVARIIDTPGPGPHTVRWRVVGADGHPVSGDLSWVVLSAVDAAPPTPVADPTPEDPAPPPPAVADADAEFDAEFDAESPGYVAVRWLTFVALLGVLGAASYGILVLPLGRGRAGVSDVRIEPDRRDAATLGLVAAASLFALAGARLVAQAFAVYGTGTAFDPGRLGSLLSGGLWGWGWILQTAAALGAMLAFAAARRGAGAAWPLAGLAAAALALTPALSGHAAAVARLAPLPILVDGVHVLAAGGWLGTLLVLLWVGVRRAVRGGGGNPGVPLPALVAAFSATALVFAAVVVGTGVFSAWLHLPSLAHLWESEYGKVLLFKVALVLPVLVTGAYNWRRVRPALAEGEGVAALRLSGWTEVALAVLVLLVSAVLVATPTPDLTTHDLGGFD